MRIHFVDWTLDTETRELSSGDQPVHLSPKAFRLLEVLIERRPAAVSKEQLSDILWPDTIVTEGNLSSLMKEIRTTVGDDARSPKVIRTKFSYGYAFIADVTIETAPKKTLESVAVLPFANASGPEWDYLGDGIPEELLNVLTRLRSIRVAPRSTSFRHVPPVWI